MTAGSEQQHCFAIHNGSACQAVGGAWCCAAPVNQSFQTPAEMSRVDTTWAVMKSLVSEYTSMPLWLCTNTMLSRKPLNTCGAEGTSAHQ